MPLPRFSLRTRVARRILLLFILSAFAPIGVLGVLAYRDVESQLSDQAGVALRQISKDAGLTLLKRLEDVDDLLRSGVERVAAGRRPIDSVASATEPGIWITGVALVPGSGPMQSLVGRPTAAPAYSDQWASDLETGRTIIVFRDTMPLWLGRALPTARRPGATPAMVWAEVTTADVFGIDRSSELGAPGTTLCVLTGSGAPVYCPNRAGGSAHQSARWGLFLRGRFSAPPLTIVVSEPRETVLAPMRAFQRTFPLLVVLTLAVAVLLGAVLIRRSTEPLVQLQEGTRRLSALDFSSPVRIASGDEFETLADSFNAMAERLRGQLVESERLNTALGRASDALRESETRLRTILDTAADAIVTTNADGTVEAFNQAAERIFGRARGDVIGRSAAELLIDAPDTAGDPFRRPGPVRPIRGRRKNGKTFPMELLVSEAQLPGRSLFTGFARDVSERQRAEEDRLSLEAQLRQAQKLETLGTLAGGIAHDFNNILAAVLGYVHLAREQLPQNSPVVDDLLEVERAAGRATELARQILLFSRRTDQRRRPVLVDEIVHEVYKLLRPSLPATIDIQRALEPHTPPVDADPTQLHQVLLNLCTNAAHAMPGGGLLAIGLAAVELTGAATDPATLTPGRYVRLTVRDTGRGMDRATRERIFEPFFTTKAPGEGTGLGLSVVHGIVTSHGGAIDVESAPGVGTTFAVYLPAGSATEVQRPPAPAARVYGSEHLLVVDDDLALATVTQRVLERAGYRVTMRTSGPAALALLSSGAACDLLLTDETMPGLTGMQLAEAVHRLRPELPIILSTGLAEAPETAALVAVGVRETLLKPINPQDLALAVRRILHPQGVEAR